jgi:hypothetical protein
VAAAPFSAAVSFAALTLVWFGATTAADPQDADYRHGYYLFLRSPKQGCEDCYIPLLLTKEPLERVVNGRAAVTVMITTYERDSIVGLRRGVRVESVDIRDRSLRLGDKQYRYHEASAKEVLDLLQHPEGSIPIHRTPEMAVPGREELRDLIAAFQVVR